MTGENLHDHSPDTEDMPRSIGEAQAKIAKLLGLAAEIEAGLRDTTIPRSEESFAEMRDTQRRLEDEAQDLMVIGDFGWFPDTQDNNNKEVA